MAVRKILPALLITQGEGRGWTWIFTSPCCSATQAYYLNNCLVCGQIQSGSGFNMLDKGPTKSGQDTLVHSAVSVPWRIEFLSIPEAMKLGSFNNTKQKDRALQMEDLVFDIGRWSWESNIQRKDTAGETDCQTRGNIKQIRGEFKWSGNFRSSQSWTNLEDNVYQTERLTKYKKVRIQEQSAKGGGSTVYTWETFL